MDTISKDMILETKKKVKKISLLKSRIAVLKKIIKDNEEILALVAVPSTSCVGVAGSAPGGGDSSEERQLMKREELRQENIAKTIEIANMVQTIHRLETAISYLDQPYRDIIKYRFIEHMTWKETASALDCGQRTCCRYAPIAWERLTIAMQEMGI